MDTEIILKLNGEEFRKGEIIYITFYEMVRDIKTKELTKHHRQCKVKIIYFTESCLYLDASTECNSEKIDVHFTNITEIRKKRSHREYINSCNRIK